MNAIQPVYVELVDFVARGATPEKVAGFRPSPEAQERVAELLERQRDSQLTEEETAAQPPFAFTSTEPNLSRLTRRRCLERSLTGPLSRASPVSELAVTLNRDRTAVKRDVSILKSYAPREEINPGHATL